MEIALRFLWGEGIEIGAKGIPTFKESKQSPPHRDGPSELRVLQVDEMSQEDLIKKYGGTDGQWYQNLLKTPIDRVDNAETLRTFPNESVDFVIACHVLEHVTDFLGTLETFGRVVRSRGIVFIALPDKRYNIEDFARALTPPSHHLETWGRKIRIAEDRVDEVADGMAANSWSRGQKRIDVVNDKEGYPIAAENIPAGHWNGSQITPLRRNYIEQARRAIINRYEPDLRGLYTCSEPLFVDRQHDNKAKKAF